MNIKEEILNVYPKNSKLRDTMLDSLTKFNSTGIHFIPVIHLVTVQDVGDYFGVSKSIIDFTYLKYKEEFGDDVVCCKHKEIRDKLYSYGYYVRNNPEYGFTYKDGEKEYTIDKGKYYFSLRGIYRMALFLPESEVAKNIRDEMVDNIVKNNMNLSEKVTKRQCVLSKEEIEILESESKRKEYINSIASDEKAIAILNRVKKIYLIEDFRLMTFNMIADYLEVKPSILIGIYRKLPFEFTNCVFEAKAVVSNMFSPIAVIRFAFLIKNSDISQKIRKAIISKTADDMEKVIPLPIIRKKETIQKLKVEHEKLIKESEQLREFFDIIGSGLANFAL